MIDFYHMASTTEEWECPECHYVHFLDDDGRAMIALRQPLMLKCPSCGKESDGLAVKRREGTDYSFRGD